MQHRKSTNINLLVYLDAETGSLFEPTGLFDDAPLDNVALDNPEAHTDQALEKPEESHLPQVSQPPPPQNEDNDSDDDMYGKFVKHVSYDSIAESKFLLCKLTKEIHLKHLFSDWVPWNWVPDIYITVFLWMEIVFILIMILN